MLCKRTTLEQSPEDSRTEIHISFTKIKAKCAKPVTRGNMYATRGQLDLGSSGEVTQAAKERGYHETLR